MAVDTPGRYRKAGRSVMVRHVAARENPITDSRNFGRFLLFLRDEGEIDTSDENIYPRSQSEALAIMRDDRVLNRGRIPREIALGSRVRVRVLQARLKRIIVRTSRA